MPLDWSDRLRRLFLACNNRAEATDIVTYIRLEPEMLTVLNEIGDQIGGTVLDFARRHGA